LFDTYVTPLNNGQTSLQITLNADGTYEIVVLTPTSTVTADETVEHGTFVFGGSMITFTPTERTCTTPLTSTTDSYLVNGAGLGLFPATGGALLLARSAPLSTTGLTLVIGCGAPFMPVAMMGSDPVPANPGSSPSPYGSWLWTSGTLSIEYTLNQDMTYELQVLSSTSTVSGNEYIEKGTFAFQGQALVLTPTQASCPQKKPVVKDPLSLNGTNLVLTDSSGTNFTFARTNTSQLGANLTLVIGCSINNSPWMPEPIAPVTN
jgi:hypothetical protein